MKISLNWIKEYVEIPKKSEILAHKLTLSGQEVEKIEDVEGDTVFELEVTPNRPDCLNFIGLAREISAILNKTLRQPKIKKVKFSNNKCDILIQDKKDCHRYIGAIIKDVCVKPVSQDIKKKIFSLGLRSVNNIVDITNFCLMETGQPMHAFDYDKLEGGKVIVRRAKKGEKIIAIDDVEYALDPSILVIADAKRPVAIAGIMGGKDTEVTKKTKNILLESAYFDPSLIRRASRKLALRSDSSYRFERGVDMDTVETGANRAIDLIQQSAGGTPFARKDAYFTKKKKVLTSIGIEKDKIDRVLGASFSVLQIKIILKKLEFNVLQGAKNKLKVIPPSFRQDIKSDVDIIEEIARIVGYDQLPLKLPEIKAQNVPVSKTWIFKQKLRNALTGQGLDEIIGYTMIGTKALDRAKIDCEKPVCNSNPLTEDQQIMRPSALPSLLDVVSLNSKRGQKDLKVFELGKIYLPSGEKEILSIAMTGRACRDWRVTTKKKISFYDIKGVVEAVSRSFNVGELLMVSKENASFEKGQSARICFKDKIIGFLGKIDASILSEWEIKHQDVFFAQIETAVLYKESQRLLKYKSVSEYPCVVRDISLAVKKETLFQKIKETIVSLNEELLTKVDFVEQYLGEKLPPDHRGITVSLTYQSFKRTLTENEVEQIHDRICQKIISDLEAIKR